MAKVYQNYTPRLARGHGSLLTRVIEERMTEQERAQGLQPRKIRVPVCNRPRCIYHEEQPGKIDHYA
jgi:hypothetical protein